MIELTLTPLLPTSNDIHLVNWSKALFDIMYGSMFGCVFVQAILEMFIITPTNMNWIVSIISWIIFNIQKDLLFVSNALYNNDLTQLQPSRLYP